VLVPRTNGTSVVSGNAWPARPQAEISGYVHARDSLGADDLELGFEPHSGLLRDHPRVLHDREVFAGKLERAPEMSGTLLLAGAHGM
jgi:hypothetical protein